MSYSILGEDLRDTADRAKRYFSDHYGATHFRCEEALQADLPLKPTWQANLNTYKLCVEVKESPFSPTLMEFVGECANRSMPALLWVALRSGTSTAEFRTELRRAQEFGIGVVELGEDGRAHEFHKPAALSLFALKKTNFKKVPKGLRGDIKLAEDTLLGGEPHQGCQSICQQLEVITRKVAEHTYALGLWRTPGGSKPLSGAFFAKGRWAPMLDAFDTRIDERALRKKCPKFTRAKIAGARAYTDWRNQVSHKPKTASALRTRDARLRTMYEVTRDLLIEWYEIAKQLKLVK